MARLLNSEKAIVDIRKIADYCLNPTHPRGRHKARLFKEMLEIGQTDAPWLRDILLQSVRKYEALEIATDIYGSRWRIDIPVTRHDMTVVVRTVWIVRNGEDIPRCVTCWVL